MIISQDFGSVFDDSAQRMIAPIQKSLVAIRDYYQGQCFIYDGVNYKVTKADTTSGGVITAPAIATGDTINLSTDVAIADTITDMLYDKGSTPTGYDTPVNIPIGASNAYEFPSDGLLVIRTGASGAEQIMILDVGASTYTFDAIVTASSVAPYANSTFCPVLKGQKAYVADNNHSGSARYFPYKYN